MQSTAQINKKKTNQNHAIIHIHIYKTMNDTDIQ